MRQDGKRCIALPSWIQSPPACPGVPSMFPRQQWKHPSWMKGFEYIIEYDLDILGKKGPHHHGGLCL